MNNKEIEIWEFEMYYLKNINCLRFNVTTGDIVISA